MLLSRVKKMLSFNTVQENIKDSNFKRNLASDIIRINNKYISRLALILAAILIFSGSGDGVVLFGQSLKPISETAVALLANITGYLLKGWQDEKQMVLSYYFFNKQQEDQEEKSIREETIKNDDILT